MSNSHDNCQLVVFSNKAWNAIVNETFRKDPVETGGILLGHILSNGYWIVMEVIPPGLRAIHQIAYFEYDTEFVNYMANSVSRQYKMELSVLGLWHRHPGSMDVFSGTDDGTNATFAQMNPYGAISGLVNIDPKLRFTLRHVSYPLHYQIVDVEVGDDLIPSQYFELKYSFGDDLVPVVPTGNGESPKTKIAEPERDRNTRQPSTEPIRDNKGDNHPKMKNSKLFWHWVIVGTACLLFFVIGWLLGINRKPDTKDADSAKTQTLQLYKYILEEVKKDSTLYKIAINELIPSDANTSQTTGH